MFTFGTSRRTWRGIIAASLSLPMLAHAQSREAAPSASPCTSPASGSVAQAYLRAEEPSANGTVVVTLCLVSPATTNRIGSYRGEVRFDSTIAEVVKVESGMGGMRAENPAQRGRLLFAGASPSGFNNPVVLRATLRLLRGERALPRLTLLMKEIWSVAGFDLSRQAQVRGYSGDRTTSAGKAVPDNSTSLASLVFPARGASRSHAI